MLSPVSLRARQPVTVVSHTAPVRAAGATLVGQPDDPRRASPVAEEVDRQRPRHAAAHHAPAPAPGCTAQPPMTLVNDVAMTWQDGRPPIGVMRPVAGYSQAGRAPLTGSRSPADQGASGPGMPSGRAG